MCASENEDSINEAKYLLFALINKIDNISATSTYI
jgi:hypothetical protein